MWNRVNVVQLTADLQAAATGAGFTAATYGTVDDYRLLGLVRSAAQRSPDQRAVYLSAGIHGDEPAGPLALLELLRSDALPRHHDYVICPLMNPTGLEAGTRENHDGLDLNRGYSDFRAVELRTHRDWLQRQLRALDLSIHLHEDWEAQGFYLYELNFGDAVDYADRMLRAVIRFLPVESATLIDGRPAKAGVIRPETIPDLPEGMPEAIYLQQNFGGLNYTIETPSTLPMDLRVGAQKAAVLATL